MKDVKYETQEMETWTAENSSADRTEKAIEPTDMRADFGTGKTVITYPDRKD